MGTAALTVLIVDDDRTLRNALESMLVPMGYRVLSAGSGDTAYSLLAEHPVDAVLLDVRMPLISGPALFLAIISRWPELAGRVAMMTGDADADDVRPWLEQHRCVVFRKPFRPQPIVDWLASIVRPRDRKAVGRGKR
jgi:two-component system OmpR family response regulator